MEYIFKKLIVVAEKKNLNKSFEATEQKQD